MLGNVRNLLKSGFMILGSKLSHGTRISNHSYPQFYCCNSKSRYGTYENSLDIDNFGLTKKIQHWENCMYKNCHFSLYLNCSQHSLQNSNQKAIKWFQCFLRLYTQLSCCNMMIKNDKSYDFISFLVTSHNKDNNYKTFFTPQNLEMELDSNC